MGAGTLSFRCATSSKMLIISRPCRRPTSKSLKSCAGVILTAPEPCSGSAVLVGDDGQAAADQRQDGVPADEVRGSARPPAWTATAVSPSMVSGRVVATTMVARRPRPRSDSLKCQSLPSLTSLLLRPPSRRSRCGASGSQLTSRWSLIDQALACSRVDEDACRTAAERPSSMVKRSRRQSQEAPSRRAAVPRMVPPDSQPSTSQTRSTNFVAPEVDAWRCRPPPACRSTTIWVAIPAWSMPGCQRTSRPRIRSISR